MGEGGEGPEQSPLDKLFKGILDEWALRVQEKQEHEPAIAIGKGYYQLTVNPQTELRISEVRATSLREKCNIERPPERPDLSLGPPTQVYLNRIIRAIDAYGKDPIGGKEVLPGPKYFLYGFGMEALEQGDISTALVALDKGVWLNDKFEGQEIQRSIAQKVETLDPKARVETALTWKRIQEAKGAVQSNPQNPPSPTSEP